MDILAAYLANQPASSKRTRTSGKGKRSGNNAAVAFFARQTLVDLAGVLTPGSHDFSVGARPAPNLAYADLLELRELAHDVLLHRDTSERRKHPIFQDLSIFAQDGTSPFSVPFRHWGHRYGERQEASARTWGICRIPTETDFLRQTWEGKTLEGRAQGDPTNSARITTPSVPVPCTDSPCVTLLTCLLYEW
jgi:hypothetical protein